MYYRLIAPLLHLFAWRSNRVDTSIGLSGVGTSAHTQLAYSTSLLHDLFFPLLSYIINAKIISLLHLRNPSIRLTEENILLSKIDWKETYYHYSIYG